MVHRYVPYGRLEENDLHVSRQVVGDGQDASQYSVVSGRRFEGRVFHQRVLGVRPDRGQVVSVLRAAQVLGIYRQ